MPESGSACYKMSGLSKCQGYLTIAYLFYGRFTGRFFVVKQTAEFSVPAIRLTNGSVAYQMHHAVDGLQNRFKMIAPLCTFNPGSDIDLNL